MAGDIWLWCRRCKLCYRRPRTGIANRPASKSGCPGSRCRAPISEDLPWSRILAFHPDYPAVPHTATKYTVSAWLWCPTCTQCFNLADSNFCRHSHGPLKRPQLPVLWSDVRRAHPLYPEVPETGQTYWHDLIEQETRLTNSATRSCPVFLPLLLILLLTACADTAPPAIPATATPTAQPPTIAPTRTPTTIPTSTHTPAPTRTPKPTSTSTSIPTPTVEPLATMNDNDVNVRTGPGFNYTVLKKGRKGDQFRVSGKNADGEWCSVVDAADGTQGWVMTQYLTLNIDIVTLPTVVPPPSPTPTPTPDTAAAESQYRVKFHDWCCGVGGYVDVLKELNGYLEELDRNPNVWSDASWNARVLLRLRLIDSTSSEIRKYKDVPKRYQGVHNDLKTAAKKMEFATIGYRAGINNRNSRYIDEANQEVAAALRIIRDASEKLDE